MDGKIMSKQFRAEMGQMFDMLAKSFIANYAALQSSVISVLKTRDESFVEECMNNFVEILKKEFSLTEIENHELLSSDSYEDCISVITEKTRVIKSLVQLFLVTLIDQETVDSFLEEIDRLSEQQKEYVKSSMIVGNVH